MLTRLIAHQITKAKHSTEATLNLRNKVLPIDTDMAIALLDQLRESFISRSPISGRFREARKEEVPKEEAPTKDTFQQMLLSYLDDPDDSRFVAFTRQATESLRGEMVKQRLATGGYVIFAEYKPSRVAFLLTALLTTTDQPSFDEKLNLIASTSLDLAHLRHGSRTRLASTAVRKNAQGVVEFISDRLSEYFVDFIGCEAMVQPEVQGKLLYAALRKFAVDQNLSEEATSELMGGAYSHVEDARKAGRPITQKGLANAVLPDEPEPLLAHLADEETELAGQFHAPPPQTMKRFVRFAFSGDGLKLEFDRDPWANRINLDKERRTLTIVEVPESLVAALSEGV